MKKIQSAFAFVLCGVSITFCQIDNAYAGIQGSFLLPADDFDDDNNFSSGYSHT